MRQIRVAAQLHPQQGSYLDLRQPAANVEGMGFDLVYTWDHLFPLYGDPDGKHGPSM